MFYARPKCENFFFNPEFIIASNHVTAISYVILLHKALIPMMSNVKLKIFANLM